MNMVRCMLADKEVPKEYWPEAVNWAVHVLNRCPTSAVKGMTPEEAWSGHKPSIHHFRIFGCVGHVHIPDVNQKKVDDKSFKCVFLGVSKESKAYRMYDPEAERIVISRDVVFEEEEKWSWDKPKEEMSSGLLEWEDSNKAIEEEEHVEEEGLEEEIGNSPKALVDGSPDSPVGGSPNPSVGDSPKSPAGHMSNSPFPTDAGETSKSTTIQGRNRRKPGWMEDYVVGEDQFEEETQQFVMFTPSDDPVTFEEAVKSPQWRDAMTLEIQAIEKNGTWELTELPDGAKKIGVKWLFKTKLNEKGEVDKFKARLVAKGYAQQYGIDYDEIFAPVARWDTIRLIMALAASRSWVVYQLDVKKRLPAW